jgi:AcrR family transcriptional regulator
MRSGTRERIVETTAELFRRHGYTGTGLKQIVAEANAPFGSIYHHFPNGKAQLGEEVIRSSGRMYFELFEAIFDAAPDVVSATGDFFVGAAETLRQTDYADACPIATVALEVASTNEPLRQATADVFDSWIDGATRRLVDAGVPEKRARELAIGFLAALEGAFVLSRATKSTEPLEVAGEAATAAVKEALA